MSFTNMRLPAPSGNVTQCLIQMMADANEIEKRLFGAPLDLTAASEPRLHKIIKEIKGKLVEAKEAWPD